MWDVMSAQMGYRGVIAFVTVVYKPQISPRRLQGDPILLHRPTHSEHIDWSYRKHIRLDSLRESNLPKSHQVFFSKGEYR